jgi:NAD(P)-dependent dehydrogenase (short-subunit alcohol dehydrogenase family)
MANIVLVTGAAGALGSVLVRRLVSGGARVAAIDLPRSAERLDVLAKEQGGGCLALPLDILDAGAWTSALARVEAQFGPPDGAVLVAGGWRGGTPFHAEGDSATWDLMMTSNLVTVERTLRALLPGMAARRAGSVVLVGARPAVRPWMGAGAAAYTASKAAVIALAQAIAAEVLEERVRINAILPSMIDTPANRAGMPDADFSRWVAPESIAEVIAFLLSDAARDVSGAAIPVYGRS